MTQVIPLKIHIQSPIRDLRVSKHETYIEKESGFKIADCNLWRVWLTANRDFTLGTFIQLCPNGVINRVTLHADGTDSIFRIDSDDT